MAILYIPGNRRFFRDNDRFVIKKGVFEKSERAVARVLGRPGSDALVATGNLYATGGWPPGNPLQTQMAPSHVQALSTSQVGNHVFIESMGGGFETQASNALQLAKPGTAGAVFPTRMGGFQQPLAAFSNHAPTKGGCGSKPCAPTSTLYTEQVSTLFDTSHEQPLVAYNTISGSCFSLRNMLWDPQVLVPASTVAATMLVGRENAKHTRITTPVYVHPAPGLALIAILPGGPAVESLGLGVYISVPGDGSNGAEFPILQMEWGTQLAGVGSRNAVYSGIEGSPTGATELTLGAFSIQGLNKIQPENIICGGAFVTYVLIDGLPVNSQVMLNTIPTGDPQAASLYPGV